MVDHNLGVFLQKKRFWTKGVHHCDFFQNIAHLEPVLLMQKVKQVSESKTRLNIQQSGTKGKKFGCWQAQKKFCV